MNDNEKINSKVKFESLDASARWLGVIGAFIVILAIILPFLLWGVYGYLEETAANGSPISEAESRQRFDQPRPPQLEPNPILDYKEYRDKEINKLNSYGWIDREKGIVHIPIEQAMKILAVKGLPEIGAAKDAQKAGNSNQSPLDLQMTKSPAPNENGGRK